MSFFHYPKWALSSAGRASPLQGEGRGFDPLSAHHLGYQPSSKLLSLPPSAPTLRWKCTYPCKLRSSALLTQNGGNLSSFKFFAYILNSYPSCSCSFSAISAISFRRSTALWLMLFSGYSPLSFNSPALRPVKSSNAWLTVSTV